MSSVERQAPVPQAPRAHPATAGSPGFDPVAYGHQTTVLGMWLFLVNELLLFGGLFTAYFVYRYVYAEAFREGSSRLPAEVGAINTAVLILSSLMVALATRSAQARQKRALLFFLGMTLLLGTTFLVIKGFEYREDYREGLVPWLNFAYQGEQARQVALFFTLYFFMTGLHLAHMLIGLGLVALVFVLAARGRYQAGPATSLEVTALYWHFVDVVWVFIFPLLYLIGPN